MAYPRKVADPLGMSRRELLGALGGTVVAAGAAGATLAAWPGTDDSPIRGDEHALDDVLRRMQAMEPKCLQGLSSHAPMAVEAMCALGEHEQAGRWYRQFRGPERELPPARRPIDQAQWKAALGLNVNAVSWQEANHRWGDWKEFFTAALAENPWPQVLDLWVGRLAPGLSGAATHGVIRTAHAARGLSRKQTPERLGELARGLAYWASSYEELPAGRRQAAPLATFAAALEEVPLYRDAFGRSPQGRNIVEVLRHVRQVPGFDAVKDGVIVPADLGAGLSALTATFARVFLRYGTGRDTIAFVHAVTGPAALRRLAPHLSAATAREAFPYAWQTAAAVFSAYVKVKEKGRKEESKLTTRELAARAIAHGDEHAIKFTEVMLDEHQHNPDPIYLAAAEEAIVRL